MATFGTLVSRLQDHFSTGSGSAARYLQFLNEWHRRILNLPGCEEFRRSTIDVAVLAGETCTRLPISFTRYEHLVDVTNNLRLEEKTLGWYRAIPPNTYTSGTSFCYVPYGVSAVSAQPVAAGTKTYAISTSASDTTQKVYVRVRLATGQEVSASATITGLAGVQVGTWTNAVEVLQFFIDVLAVGSIKLGDDATPTNVYGTIYPPDLNANRSVIILVPTPAAALTLRVDGIRAMEATLATTDQHWLPEEWEHLLELGARVNEYEMQDDDRWQRVRQELDVELRRFKFALFAAPDQRFVPGESRVETGSNLGPWYPKGRW